MYRRSLAKNIVIAVWFFAVINMHGYVAVMGPFDALADCKEIATWMKNNQNTILKTSSCWKGNTPIVVVPAQKIETK